LPADRVAYFDKNFHKGMAQCRHFLAISDFGRQEVIRTLGIPPERVTRTYMGIRPGLGPVHRQEVSRVLHDLGLPPRYLLYVGTIEPRKNILMLLRAYCALPHELRSAWPLLLVGNWGWNTAHIAEFYHHEARHRGVIHAGYVKNKSLAAVYTGARALVYPSLYEGFGLPPVEMMACGGAVLASTAGALVETIGSRAHLIPPQDIDGWIATMTRVLLDDDWCFSLRRGVAEIAKPFTWDLCAAETLTVYRTLCNEERVSNAA
jgi:alpha-1,3-rhamnosyl/mannosyltransferase